MRLKVCTLIVLLLFFKNVHFAYANDEITEKNLQTHINFLCSNALEGRLTGSHGEKLATDYIANIFLRLGLSPAGDNGTFFQAFNFNAGVLLGKNNFFSIIGQKGVITYLMLDQDWRPLSFSDSHSFKTNELIFAGFGITAPVLEKLPAYDSYRGVEVKNKWIVVFRNFQKKYPPREGGS